MTCSWKQTKYIEHVRVFFFFFSFKLSDLKLFTLIFTCKNSSGYVQLRVFFAFRFVFIPPLAVYLLSCFCFNFSPSAIPVFSRENNSLTGINQYASITETCSMDLGFASEVWLSSTTNSYEFRFLSKSKIRSLASPPPFDKGLRGLFAHRRALVFGRKTLDNNLDGRRVMPRSIEGVTTH